MDLFISDKKLRRAIEQQTLDQRYGTDMSKRISLRLNTLRAAESLGDFWPPKSGPERCHELKGDLIGIFSVDLKHPYRLLFKPKKETPPPDRSDERQRWQSITAIDILAIEDTHE